MGIFFTFLIQFFFRSFGTSGSMIPRLIPEVSPSDGFCDEEEEEKLGIPEG